MRISRGQRRPDPGTPGNTEGACPYQHEYVLPFALVGRHGLLLPTGAHLASPPSLAIHPKAIPILSVFGWRAGGLDDLRLCSQGPAE